MTSFNFMRIIKRTIVNKYIRFLVNLVANKKLSVKILYKDIWILKSSYKFYENMLRVLRFCLEFKHMSAIKDIIFLFYILLKVCIRMGHYAPLKLKVV